VRPPLLPMPKAQVEELLNAWQAANAGINSDGTTVAGNSKK
jgi:hypothetical protein